MRKAMVEFARYRGLAINQVIYQCWCSNHFTMMIFMHIQGNFLFSATLVEMQNSVIFPSSCSSVWRALERCWTQPSVLGTTRTKLCWQPGFNCLPMMIYVTAIPIAKSQLPKVKPNFGCFAEQVLSTIQFMQRYIFLVDLGQLWVDYISFVHKYSIWCF